MANLASVNAGNFLLIAYWQFAALYIGFRLIAAHYPIDLKRDRKGDLKLQEPVRSMQVATIALQ